MPMPDAVHTGNQARRPTLLFVSGRDANGPRQFNVFVADWIP